MLFIFCIGGLYLTNQKSKAYQEGAYKYEYIKLTADKNSLAYLLKIDSVFDKKKPSMINYVDKEGEKLNHEIIP